MTSALSRRQFAAGLASLPALGVFSTRQARAAGSVVAAAFPNAWEDAYRKIVAPLVAAQGTQLVVSPALAQDQLAKLLASPGKPSFDAVLMSPGQTAEAVSRGLIEKIDPSKLKNWDKLEASARTEYGPNVTVEINGIAYNPTMVPKPAGYKDLFENKAYDGKVAWIGFGSNTAAMAWVEIAKLYGGGEDNMEPVFKLLASHMPKVGAIANNGSAQMTMFQQGEIGVFMASTGNVARLKSLGVPCEFVHPISGSPSVPVTIHLAKGAANPEGVYQYMDAAISAEAQSKLALPPTEMIPTNSDVPLTPGIKSFVSEDDLKKLVYPDWAKINAKRAAWTAEFDRVVRK
ncbi:putative spermidine/putrescine transport system substrate-binding protein [Bosea lupini]|uniref:Putative spermidine/putrescine transport system substrate-binding protein n=1 Tax=Bosea lupini TaxID=1036779 RepID=A0A1H8AP23_9HYPH|nr:extracellular solute-binding protein [Bosea lupini]SEM71724.1 putative spermidine/putrescine transport system substrate-binding protein [Bosea lupini]